MSSSCATTSPRTPASCASGLPARQGGHNGLKSIIARLGGDGFPRIRIGVGAKPRPDYDLADWVLGKFPAEDAKALADRCPDIEAAAKLIMDGKLSLAQSKYNG